MQYFFESLFTNYIGIMEQKNISKEDTNLSKNDTDKNVPTQDLSKVMEAESTQEVSVNLEEKCKDLQDKYLRAKADLENARKRFLKDKEDIRFQTTQYACLPIIGLFDSFKMGIESAEQHKISEDVLKGFQMIFQQFQTTLKMLGVEAIDPKNDAFNPHFHEAVSSIFHDNIPEDHIVQVVRVGYKMGDKLIRPASVVVSKGQEKE